jgi:hypothetical protein
MMVAALAGGGVLLLVMAALSWHGAVTLPAGARVPVHWGFGWNNWVPKRLALAVWPGAGALIYGLLAGVAVADSSRGAQAGLVPVVLMVVIMGALTAFQAGALAAARRVAGAGSTRPGPL